ncbi:hypothetical protein [Rhizobium laguerreae]|uniref:hypothetical protein n=1 Tax=Rhizobium laguerreae TaxID=1076926 RepID=UPI001C8FCCFD|nr:hypothetical protein [Rhizobium laguerreae]MBY3343649.1 hypothetical protein [Rhizobium laguerreae]MBY3350683.1 hypothetical protein [Rhizobium laguerreae]MBY3371787.1 hypothetical protein [Rhizobium laguerreae]MBY3427025.1 hypothetical protein [Rhizobium laguerreae]MBY3435533.1 hypothetical protein [Rhizobium laguerreae]
MKQTVKPGPTPENWDAEALFLKAQRYAERMAASDGDGWEQPFWSSLSLELLARAALSNVSPALLVENDKDWTHLYHALGFEPLERKSPKSITVTEVFKRLAGIYPETFISENYSFCVVHTGRRNSELHSGEAVFEGIASSSWQPQFYAACTALLATMGLTLTDFIDGSEADVAGRLIAAAADKGAKAVLADVEAHRKEWLALSDGERASLAESAKVWATRQAGHRVTCPACSSIALVQGEAITPSVVKLDAEQSLVVETQDYLPSQFECVACRLKIHGLSRLAAVNDNLAKRFQNTSTYDAAEYYATEDDYPGYEEDNNERF